MDMEQINKLIQSENDRHQRNLNKIDSDKCREKERHQRQMEYLNRQKESIKRANANKVECLYQNDVKYLLNKLNEVLNRV